MPCGNHAHDRRGDGGGYEMRGPHGRAGRGDCCRSEWNDPAWSKAEQKAWLEFRKQRLEARLAEVNQELAQA